MSPRALAVALALVISHGPARGDEREDPWQRGQPRPFLSAAVDLGSLEHVALAAGWGKPHLMWGGLIAHGLLTPDFASLRTGVRIDLQALALEAGLRRDSTFRHLPLPDLERQTAIPDGDGFSSRSLDLAAAGGLPLGPGFALYEVLAVRSLSSPGKVQLYDEVLRIVYRPRWLVTASAGWLASLRGGALLLGGRTQWACKTGRGGDPFVRLGPVGYWRLWPHLALAGELLYPVSTPDRTAFTDPIEAFLVLSFTAATGDRPARFP